MALTTRHPGFSPRAGIRGFDTPCDIPVGAQEYRYISGVSVPERGFVALIPTEAKLEASR